METESSTEEEVIEGQLDISTTELNNTMETVGPSQVLGDGSEPQLSTRIHNDTPMYAEIMDNELMNATQEEFSVQATEVLSNPEAQNLEVIEIDSKKAEFSNAQLNSEEIFEEEPLISELSQITIKKTVNAPSKSTHPESKSISFASPNTPPSHQPKTQKRAAPLSQNFDLDSDSDDSFIQDTELGISDAIQVHTEIQSLQKPKLNYGGWKNVKSNVVYMNAVAQTTTAREIKDKIAPVMFHRDCQTIVMHEKTIQAPKEVSTQMDVQFLYLSPIGDKIIVARPYITAMEEEGRFLERLVVCQSIARRFLAIKNVAKLKDLTNKRIKKKNDIFLKLAEAEEARKNREIERRLHPKTQKDFELLYNGLEDWRVKQLDTLHAHKPDDKQKNKYMVNLINTEAALIQKIDAMKLAAGKQNHEYNMNHLIDKMSKSKEWSIKGQLEKIFVDTPEIIRAKFLKGLYNELKAPISDIDTRLQILLRIKQTVKEYDCNLCREIIDLVDREGDLMTRGRKQDSLLGLRQRIDHLVFQFIRNPEFNPVARTFNTNPLYQKIETIYYCKGCAQYLGASDFSITSAMNKLGRCRVCLGEEEISIARHDDIVYQKLIRHMKRDELKNGSDGREMSFIDIVQEKDLRYLVETIWGGKSAISGISIMTQLRICRWDKMQPLTPWNMMLVTKSERQSHLETDGKIKSYTEEFLRMVHGRHNAGRVYFSRLFESSKIGCGESVERDEDVNVILNGIIA